MSAPNTIGTDKKEILKLAIEEQRRVYDWQVGNYQRLKSQALIYLGGGLASLTFLYDNGQTFIPPERYGQIFYVIGLSLVVFALGALLVALKPRHWEHPTEIEDLEKLNHDSIEDYSTYVKDRYILCYKMNRVTSSTRLKFTNMSFYPLVFGIIVLVILKLFRTST